MTFNVAAESYGRFMGRFSVPLACQFVELAELTGSERVLDVGAGTGALTAELVRRLSPSAVSAIDPSAPFVTALADEFPGVEVRSGVAEQLPWPDDTFDVTMAQLVVHFLADPVAGLREMARVTRPGGRVAACVWDLAGGGGPLATFWAAVHDLDPDADDESGLPGGRAGQLAALGEAAGLRQIESSSLQVRVDFPDFDAWWTPFTLGVGPAGGYVRSLNARSVERLRQRGADLLPPGPFTVTGSAWCLRARSG